MVYPNVAVEHPSITLASNPLNLHEQQGYMANQRTKGNNIPPDRNNAVPPNTKVDVSSSTTDACVDAEKSDTVDQRSRYAG